MILFSKQHIVSVLNVWILHFSGKAGAEIPVPNVGEILHDDLCL